MFAMFRRVLHVLRVWEVYEVCCVTVLMQYWDTSYYYSLQQSLVNLTKLNKSFLFFVCVSCCFVRVCVFLQAGCHGSGTVSWSSSSSNRDHLYSPQTIWLSIWPYLTPASLCLDIPEESWRSLMFLRTMDTSSHQCGRVRCMNASVRLYTPTRAHA